MSGWRWRTARKGNGGLPGLTEYYQQEIDLLTHPSIEIGPNHPIALLDQAQIESASSDWTVADRYFLRAAKQIQDVKAEDVEKLEEKAGEALHVSDELELRRIRQILRKLADQNDVWLDDRIEKAIGYDLREWRARLCPALQTLEQNLKDWEIELLERRGTHSLNEGKQDKEKYLPARDDLIQAIKLMPDKSKQKRNALINLAIAQLHCKELEKARRTIEEALCIDAVLPLADQDSAPSLINKAIVLAQLDRREDALDCLERVAKLRPREVVAQSNLGVARAEMGKLVEALDAYDKALGIDPHDVSSLINRSDCLARLGRLPDALSDISKAINLSKRPFAWASQGDILIQAGRFEEALTSYETAISLARKNNVVDALDLACHGITLIRISARDDVRNQALENPLREFDEALRIDQYEPLASLGRSIVNRSRKRSKEADDDLKKAKEDLEKYILLPGTLKQNRKSSPDAWFLLPADSLAAVINERGVDLGQRGTFGDAIDAFTEAIKRDDQWRPLILFNRGVARSLNGDIQGAAGDFWEATRLRKSKLGDSDPEPVLTSFGLIKDLNALDAWFQVCPKNGNQKPKLVVICTSGGGSVAAYWTMSCLAKLEEKIPGFSRHIRVVTGSSGGMLGPHATWPPSRIRTLPAGRTAPRIGRD